MHLQSYLHYLLGLFALSYFINSTAQSAEVIEMDCATTHYPPCAIYDPQKDEFSGRDIDILNRLEEMLNWKVRTFNLPWGRVKMEVAKNNYDCFFAMAYEAQRAEYVDYTHYPLHTTRYGVFYKASNPIVENKNFAGLSIGLLRGIPLAPAVLKMYGVENSHIVYLDSNETLLAMVKLGRVDASITNYDVGHYILAEMEGPKDIASYVIDGYLLPVYLVFKKGRQDIKKIDQVLSTLVAEY